MLSEGMTITYLKQLKTDSVVLLLELFGIFFLVIVSRCEQCTRDAFKRLL